MSAPATIAGAAAARVSRWRDFAPTWGAVAALVLIVLLNVAFTPHFVSAANLWNVLLQVSSTVLVGVGMTFVLATGGVDLSVGSVMALASSVAVTAIGHGFAAAIGAALAVAVAVGLVNGVCVARMGIPPFVVTLALMVIGRGAGLVMSHEGRLIGFSNPTFEWLGRGHLGPVPAQVAITAVVVGAAIFVLRSTTWGRHVIAVGGNAKAARLAGIRVERTVLAVYVVAAVLAGLAGLIETARLGTTDAAAVGANMEFAAIAAAVIGGTSLAGGRATIGGTVVGALITAVLATSVNMNGIPFEWSIVVNAAIILIAVWIQRPKLA